MEKNNLRRNISRNKNWADLLKKILKENNAKYKRKRFSKATKKAVLLMQNNHCKLCYQYLDVVDFDHINDDRSNNLLINCQALCPNCHARKTRKKRW